MKAAIATFQWTKWHKNREVEIKGLGKIPKDMQKEEQKNKKRKIWPIFTVRRGRNKKRYNQTQAHNFDTTTS